MEMKELGGKQIEVDEDGFIQDPAAWDQAVATVLGLDRRRHRHDREPLEGGELPAQLLSRVPNGADDPQALQGDGLQAQRDLRHVPQRPRQGRLQSGGPSQADRMCLTFACEGSRGTDDDVVGPPAGEDRGHRRKGGSAMRWLLTPRAPAMPSAASRIPLPIRWAMPCAWGCPPFWRAFRGTQARAKSVLLLDDVIKIRAVQEFAPSQALAFVFLLKEAIRAELGSEVPRPACSAEWANLQRQIDQVALGAFDAYVRYRGQVCELRINEVKRSVAAIVERLNRRSPSPRSGEELLQMATSTCAAAQRGGGQ